MSAPLSVPLPGGPLTAPPAAILTAARHIRQELRRLVPPGVLTGTYTIRLPGGRRLAGEPAVLLRLAMRLESAVTPLPARARVAPIRLTAAAYAPPAPGTVRLPDLDRVPGTVRLPDLAGEIDPTDPDARPGSRLYQYFGALWQPDATGPEGWSVATAEVEVWERTILYAAIRQAVTEPVVCADDEVLALRWAGALAPTCFLTAAQVRLVQRLLPVKEDR